MTETSLGAPLFLPDSLHPKKPKSPWSNFLRDFPWVGYYARARAFLRPQLVYRNESNLNLDTYWSDEKDREIVKIINDVFEEYLNFRVILLPQDPFCFLNLIIPYSDALIMVEIIMSIERRTHCVFPEDFETLETVGDLVEAMRKGEIRDYSDSDSADSDSRNSG